MEIDINTLLATLAVIISNVVTIITLYVHLDNRTQKTLDAIHEEVKDFHTRLLTIEINRHKESPRGAS